MNSGSPLLYLLAETYNSETRYYTFAQKGILMLELVSLSFALWVVIGLLPSLPL